MNENKPQTTLRVANGLKINALKSKISRSRPKSSYFSCLQKINALDKPPPPRIAMIFGFVELKALFKMMLPLRIPIENGGEKYVPKFLMLLTLGLKTMSFNVISPVYIPLKNHSAYSLLEGAINIDALIDRAISCEVPALGLSDTNNLFGAMEFSLAAQKKGVQPLLGCLLRVLWDVPEANHSKDFSKNGGLESCWLPLFVQSEEGYHNLSRLVTKTTVGQKEKWLGSVHSSQLTGMTEGLIALTGGHGGIVDTLCRGGRGEWAFKCLKFLKTLFPERLYVEIERTNPAFSYLRYEDVESQLLSWALSEDLPIVATNESFFLDMDMHQAHDALICVSEGTYISVDERRRVSPQNRFKSPQEMCELFKDLPEALENTVRIAQRCHFFLEARKPLLPPYPTPSGMSQEDALRQAAKSGLDARLVGEVRERFTEDQWPDIQAQYKERLAYELDVIIQMGFAGYFLIVADFIQHAKKVGIPVGPGRGSGASSLVAWALTITDVDPIRFQLLFERFLNPERVSMPDFDVDFCQERRDEVIRYVQKRYGSDSVAHIITFGKLQARAVLRDVGRVLQMPYSQVDKICKRIPFNPQSPLTLEEAEAQDPELEALIQSDSQVAQLWGFGKKLEGLYRHASTHAAGIVISDRPLVQLVPLYQDSRSLLPATQFSMKYVEAAGLVKFDFLGLTTLTVLEEAVQLANQTRPKPLNLLSVPLDDEPTFKLLQRVDVVGVFQLESKGMRDVVRNLQPESFEEIIALVALYRPGPMDDIPRYIACRHGHEKVVYAYPCLEGILKETFGVMVYQEQVLQIAQVLAGYSLGQADLLRRAMGKKIPAEMEAQRKIFIEGVLRRHGGDPSKAAQLFEQISKFAGYAFPKAHSAPYALVSYHTAYMKANYPAEFMVALLNRAIQNTDKIAHFIYEAHRMGIEVVSPCINKSQRCFSLAKHEEGQNMIVYGLAALKNVGEGAMDALIQEREQGGTFKDVYDFFERLSGTKVLNKRQLENLIWAGAFDCLNPCRRKLVESLEMLLKTPTASSNTPSLFAPQDTRTPLANVEEYRAEDRLQYAFQALGLYLEEHPLSAHRIFLENQDFVPSTQLEHHARERLSGQNFSMVGVLINWQQKMGKSGKKYAFLQMSDLEGSYDVMIFSELLENVREQLTPGSLFMLRVTAHHTGDNFRLVGESVRALVEVARENSHILKLKVQGKNELRILSKCLKNLPAGGTSLEGVFDLQDVALKKRLVRCALVENVALPQDVLQELQPYLEDQEEDQAL
jgi:DNA polymerase-3 subunit alpha